jgi:hypothetical protein
VLDIGDSRLFALFVRGGGGNGHDLEDVSVMRVLSIVYSLHGYGGSSYASLGVVVYLDCLSHLNLIPLLCL